MCLNFVVGKSDRFEVQSDVWMPSVGCLEDVSWILIITSSRVVRRFLDIWDSCLDFSSKIFVHSTAEQGQRQGRAGSRSGVNCKLHMHWHCQHNTWKNRHGQRLQSIAFGPKVIRIHCTILHFMYSGIVLYTVTKLKLQCCRELWRRLSSATVESASLLHVCN